MKEPKQNYLIVESSTGGQKSNEYNELKERISKFKIDLNEEIKAPETVLKIKISDKYYSVGTKAGFSVITGKPKSKKTFALSLFLDEYLSTNSTKRVLYFDTEQNKYKLQQIAKRITSNHAPANFDLFALVGTTALEKLNFIEEVLYFYNDYELVVIDGLRDLLTSINDEEQATMITTKFLKWTTEKDIHLITVLHQNKGDNNARGVIGTEVMNKAQTVMSVTIDKDCKDVSIVENVVSRDLSFESFAFEINEYGLPKMLASWDKEAQKQNSSTRKTMPNEIHVEQYKQILDWIYKDDLKNEGLRDSDFVTQIPLAWNHFFKIDLSEPKTQKVKTYIKKIGLLKDNGFHRSTKTRWFRNY